MEVKKWAVFIGGLAEGFQLKNVVIGKAAAEDIVIATLAKGTLADALEIQEPGTLKKGLPKAVEGSEYVVFGSGLAGGFTVFGPFAADEDASDFGEACRTEDEEWQIFSFEAGQ